METYFNQQGLEKYNDQASKDYFRSTNHRGSEAMKQMLLKKLRIHSLEVQGAERIRKNYHCKNCNELGHSIKNAPKNVAAAM